MVKRVTVLLFVSMIAAVSAQENRLANLCEINMDSLKVTAGSYFERRDFDEHINEDYGWITAYLQIGLETKSWAGINLGAEFLGHNQLYDTAEDRYDDDIENEAQESLSQIYIQYKSDVAQIKFGRIDSVGARHLDDNRYEGIIGNCTAIDNVKFVAGYIVSFAELDYDDAEEFYRVDKNNNGDGYDGVFLGEAIVEIADKMLVLNPFLYSQADYATVYGLDTTVTIKAGKTSFGGLVDMHHINSEITNTQPALPGYETNADSDNYHLAVFGKLPVGDALTLSTQIGNSKMAGNTRGTNLTRPNWFKDYLYIDDQGLATYAQDSRTYYIMGKIETEIAGKKCWASVIWLDPIRKGGKSCK